MCCSHRTVFSRSAVAVVVTGTCLMNMSVVHAQVCVEHFGLANCSEGQAELTIADIDGDPELELLVSNIGLSGQDGVLFNKADDDWIRELSIGFRNLLIGAPNAAYIKFDGIDAAGGTPPPVLFGLQATRVAGEVVLSWSQQPAGVTSYTVNVYNAGILVVSVASSGPPTVTTPDPPQAFKWGSGTLPPEVTGRFNFFEAWPASIQDSNGNVTTVTGDEIEMIAHEGADPGSIDAVRITGADVSTIAIEQETVLMKSGSAVLYGLVNAPMGQAVLWSNNDCDGELDHEPAVPRLHICNLGSSGNDGDRVNTPLAQLQTLTLEWLDPEAGLVTLPEGGYMDLNVVGVMPAVPSTQALGSWRVTKIAPGPGELPYELSVNFSPLGISSYDLEVRDALTGNVLYSETGRSNPVVGTQDHWPINGGAQVQSNVILVARNDSELRIAGGPTVASAAGLRIRMIVTPATLPDAISSLELKTKDIPSLTLTGEQVPAGGAIPAVSGWGLVALTLLVLTAGTLVYTRRRPAHA